MIRGGAGGEDDLIRRIGAIFRTSDRHVVVPIGDDAAVIDPPPRQRIILTTDQMVEGVHFRRALHPPDLLGDKALSVNLSDLAAMGAEPRWALLSLFLPPGLPFDYLEAVLRGMARRAKRSGTVLIGGNLTRSERFALDVTLVGALPRGIRPLTRGGARAGDHLFVSGSLGGSALGLKLLEGGKRSPAGRTRRGREALWRERALKRHFQPEPEIELGRQLSRHRLASAAMDLSDGVSRDLRRLCRASHVGALLFAESLPLDPAARGLLGAEKALEMALHGGEDYRLLYCVPPHRMAELSRRVPARKRLCIGRIIPGKPELSLEDARGRRYPLPVLGHDHLETRPSRPGYHRHPRG
ncbi:MAG TPA: thiamine-phosphate kinase [Candidatus Polarisedimenticolia bacterium]|nr:thiamine-phosphate kinase [Candidatus Polarisedimenticolia bacterium]